ncbi:hypothetical protein Zmor_013208 [Zophobas morio]|uniref:RNA-directed DNA polymerase n=1 Tax=Zophobas morio TaxID=2755281 RepID=A0AA38MEZ0_9CUCU|nr:hypothetical protein Zmor_013208 [Zophobas morio]
MLEALVEKLIKHQTKAKDKHHRGIRVAIKPESISEFTPGNPNLSSAKWIAKIEQLAKINNWDEPTMIFLMQSRLSGLARRWYDNLSTYRLSWKEWKKLLVKSFPEHRDFATTLRALVNRMKLPTESWERYYFDKVELTNACDINGHRAVSCIIDGIEDPSVQAGARAGRYTSPDRLYAEYISVLKPEKSVSSTTVAKTAFTTAHRRPLSERERSNEPPSKKAKPPARRPPKCYNCRDEGHFADKCPKPKVECASCKRLGHLTKDCRRQSIKNQVVLEKDLAPVNSSYFFDCWVNETPSQAYVDSGCGAVLIREDTANMLNMERSPCTKYVIGYGGVATKTLGKLTIRLKIDGAEAEVESLIVPNTAQEIPVLVGQTFLNQDEIMMIVSGQTVRVTRRGSDLCETLDVPPRKIPLWAKESIVLEPRTTALVAVTSRGACADDVYVRGGLRPLPDGEHVVHECITKGEDGYVAITNLSYRHIEVSPKTILVRSVVCFEEKSSPVSKVTTALPLATQSVDVVDVFDFHNLIYNQHLTPTQVRDLVSLINEFSDCFASTTKHLGKTDVLKMSIHLQDDNPVVYRPYRLSHYERQVVRDIVKDLLENEIIQESDSPYSSPIVLVKKKNGEQRMCVDYRALNAKTVKDRFPLPHVDEFVEKLKGCRYFTSLDLASGYHQLQIEASSVPKTAFVTPDGHYEFLRVPLGLCNAPAVFQRTINKVLGNLRYGKALAYMDDILLPTEDIESGMANLRLVLQSLRTAGLTLRPAKCQFFMEKVEYLGHEISGQGIRPGKAKTVAVENFPTPTDVRGVRQFLGLASYFRKYVRDFAKIAKPLTILTKKDTVFTWGDEQRIAFDALKKSLTSRPLLAIYDPQLTTEVHTDASKWGIGGILLQRQRDGTVRPVLYYSRQTTKEEQRYHSYELETMAVVYTLKAFRIYLIGLKFKVVTDCSAIRATLSKRDLVPRIGRWWLSIQDYTFDVEYRPGHKMSHADALSRNPVGLEVTIAGAVNINEDDWVLTAQMLDDRCKYLIETLQRKPEDKEERDIHANYRLINNRLYKITNNGNKWVVPKTARRNVVSHFHDENGHLADMKTISAISASYWFPGMRRYVKKYISSCLPCLYNKDMGGKKPGYMHPIEKIAVPFDTLHVDHLGPFVKSKRKNAYLIVLVDAFTKFVFMKAVPSTKARLVVNFLNSMIDNFGVPRRIISDRGSCFTSKQFTEYCKTLNIKHVLNATATPRANGQVERYNRTILASLASSMEDEQRWDEAVSAVRWGLNSTANSSTGKSPYELLFGCVPRSTGTAFLANEVAIEPENAGDVQAMRANAKARIDAHQSKRKASFDAHRRAGRTYKKGEQVLVRTIAASNQGQSKKLLPKYSGPFVITEVLTHDRYVVEDMTGSSRSQRSYRGVVSLDKLKPYNVRVSSESDGESETSHEGSSS